MERICLIGHHISLVEPRRETIETTIEEFGRSLREDGGDIELVDVVAGVVMVRLARTTVPVTFSRFLRAHPTRKGLSCGRCRIPDETIAAVLESELRAKVPEVRRVEVVK